MIYFAILLSWQAEMQPVADVTQIHQSLEALVMINRTIVPNDKTKNISLLPTWRGYYSLQQLS